TSYISTLSLHDALPILSCAAAPEPGVRLAACLGANPSFNLGRENSASYRTESVMARILVIHGAGMNMRGKVQTEIFGPMTLPEYDARIRGYASALGLEVEIFHSNVEGEIVNKLYEANDRGFDAAIFNPAAFG